MFIQVYKAIFRSPSSARDISEDEDGAENMPPAKSQRTLSGKKPTRRNVASKVNLNDKVTPRSIAYAAVQVGFMLLQCYYTSFYAYLRGYQLHFNLQTAGSWAQFYGGFDYRGLHNYIVDVFEDAPGPAAKKRAKDLLQVNWWSM